MNRLLTVKDMAEILNCHPQTVHGNLDKIPHIKTLNNSIRFRESDIEQYLTQRTVKPSSVPLELQKLSAYAMLSKKGDDMGKNKGHWSYGHGFGGIYIRRTSKGEDRYYIWFYDEWGERKRKAVKGAINKSQAERVLYSEIQKVFDMRYGNGKTEKRITFVDYSREYLEMYARIKKKSYKSDERYLAGHLVPYFGRMDISEITPPHIKGFIKKKLDAGIQKNSVNRYLMIMRSMLNIAKESGYKIGDNPVRQKDLFDESEFRRYRILSPKEEAMLLKEVSPHLVPIIRYALLSGCRSQEILGLRWDDVNLSKDTITIHPWLNKSNRLDIIPIHSELKKFLISHRGTNGKSNSVFTYGDRPVKNIRNGFLKACKRAKIKNLQFRDLRTTTATRWHDQGVDPLVISRAVLRHASFKMSEQFYIHSSLGHMKDALNGINLTHN